MYGSLPAPVPSQAWGFCRGVIHRALALVMAAKAAVQGYASAPVPALHPLSKCWRGGRVTGQRRTTPGTFRAALARHWVRSAPPAAPRRKPTLVRLRFPSGRLLSCAQSAAGATRMASYSRGSWSRRRTAGKGGRVRGYTLRDSKGRIKYVGVTNNPRRRAAEHRAGRKARQAESRDPSDASRLCPLLGKAEARPPPQDAPWPESGA